ncbi:hypothetical protein [Schaalia suimastitidis]|uniref:hypothetical protein n=1 Tax=Schaalia suimastitidis TaxID=121163 RepID=UPI000426CE61|nr:hypothetical protein [Schaalia suimastitidis]
MQTTLGFQTYVFVERVSQNAALLHPFPEYSYQTVADALTEAGIDARPFGPDMPERGELMYFQESAFDDDVLGLIADSLTLRGIGAYAYSLLDEDIGDAYVHVFRREGQAWPRSGRRIVLTRLYVGDDEDGPAATTWIFGAANDLEEALTALSAHFTVSPVADPSGVAALEIRHPEFRVGLQSPMELMDQVLQVLGSAGFEGPAFCTNVREGNL